MKRKLILVLLHMLTGILFSEKMYAQYPENVDQLRSIPFLPNPLIMDEGGKNTPVENEKQWYQQRKWIKEQYQHWISGTVPPAPASFKINVLSEKTEDSVLLRMVELYFGPGNRAKLTVELMIPPSKKLLPVFMTQWNHRGWAQIAVRRGYIGCVYAAADDKDDTQNYKSLYPDYDFSKLMIRAWAASRAVDYLFTLPQVDKFRIGITGHSRNGKQSLLAGAFDERVKAVVSSSGGTGGENPFRYTDDPFDNESINDITTNFPDWFNPRLRLFIGKEDKLPVDQNSLMTLIAPRGLLLSSALTEPEGGPWGIEQAYMSAKKVYHFLGADDKIGILFRNGRHGTSARDIENYLDYFDYVFGRANIKPENKLYYDYSFEKWKKLSNENINPLRFPVRELEKSGADSNSIAAFQRRTRKQIQWLLGDEPKGIAANEPVPLELHKQSDDYMADVITHPELDTAIKEMVIGPYNALGEYLWGNIYFPPGTKIETGTPKEKLPLVIFLHEYSHGTGYRRRCETIITNFVKRGFAVLAYDLIGYGTRIDEFKNFYSRYPHWSLMGKMIADTRLLINDACTRMSFIDKENIFLAGYSLGGTVALFTAALDNRIKGTAVVCAFSPFKTGNRLTEGIKHYSHLHGLIPRLGFFVNHENRIPLDFDEVIAAVAPQKLLVIAPTEDRRNPVREVRNTITKAGAVYEELRHPSNLLFKQPETYNHFSEGMQEEISSWMEQIVLRNE